MPMIYRRNRGLSPTRQTQHHGGVAGKTEGVDASLLGRTRRWWRGRSVVLATHRVYQTMWLAALVYAFLGLPVLGRVLNFARYVHRFSVPKMLQGLLAGLLQDLAIFLQASTLICLVKLLLDAHSVAPPAAHTALAANGAHANARVHGGFARSFPNSGFLRERSGSGRYVPVYMPVLANEYDALEAARAGVGGTTHRTLLSLGSGGGSAMNRPALARLGARAKRAAHTLLILTLLQLILVTATVASVADFCLQVTMHPRLNRAFVEIFFNYMGQFTASLLDEEVLTRTVLGSWAVYLALMAALTYGFFTGRLPLATDFLHLPRACCCCLDRRLPARKDSMASTSSTSSASTSSSTSVLPTTSTSSSTSTSYMSSLLASYWRTAKSPRPRRSSSGSGAYATAFASSSLSATLCSSGSSSSASAFAKPGPLTVLARCVLASVFVTCGALSASLLVDGKHGVDMKLMANAMFALQTEPFFERPNAVQREEINCTEASLALRSTLGVAEQYELDGLGNDDHCALLWRKTTGFQGDSFFELDFSRPNASMGTLEDTEASTANGTSSGRARDDKSSTETPPNIIVINMESWRHLDVGVLGGAAKKAATGQSATPEFDALASTGVLYRKHYTQCVQTTRTLLTMLFGMLPSCTETTALKAYGTALKVRGLPQFLKQRGYFNLFWSAVDLTWEYWDKFLVQNGFDKLVDDRKIRKMLHDSRGYQNTPDDHFSWGMHDHLSFEMLLYAIETAHNKSLVSSPAASEALATSSDVDTQPNVRDQAANASDTEASVPTAPAKGRHYHTAQSTGAQEDVRTSVDANATLSTGKPPLPGWEGLQAPYFIDMYTITSHNPWALPNFYKPPDLSALYTRFNQKYLDSMFFSDEMLGDFIRAMRARGLMRNTVVVIQGDHGYGRLEHDNNPSIADSGVWDEAGRVPFLLLADDFLRPEDRGTEVDQLSMQSDLMATIADILGVSPEQPLLQHGYGHSMKRRRDQPEAQTEAQAAQAAEMHLAGQSPVEDDAERDGETEARAAETRQDGQERRVVLCNPFNGMSKGVRTEELKYIFHPDGSFNVFEPQRDPSEKHPLRTGFDVEAMDAATRAVYDDVTRAVDLNQFLFEANRFMTPLPTPEAGQVRRRHHDARNDSLTEQEQVELQPQPGLPPP